MNLFTQLGGLREAGSWGLKAYHAERIYFLKDYASRPGGLFYNNLNL
jgi:hypothetical protein